MKDELTELIHSEFTISPEMEIKNRVGSAIEFTMMLGGDENKLKDVLVSYTVTYEDYLKWKDYWAEVGVKI